MIEEIVYTSAPQGLKPGSKGFCTVASTPGMASPLAALLESLSGYRHLSEPGTAASAQNPIVFTHFRVRLGGRSQHILSRVADAGLDYSGRSNKIAHHIVLTQQRLNDAGPAAMQKATGCHEIAWTGEPRLLNSERLLPQVNASPTICSYWKEVSGDAGWGGVCAENLVKASPAEIWIIYPASVDMLRLIAESLSLIPPTDRWNATYTTFFTKLPPNIECRLRCAVDGTPEAQDLRKRYDLKVLDLCKPIGIAPETELSTAARTGVSPRRKQIVSPHDANGNNAAVPAFNDTSAYEVDLGSIAITPPPLPSSPPKIFGIEGHLTSRILQNKNDKRGSRILAVTVGLALCLIIAAAFLGKNLAISAYTWLREASWTSRQEVAVNNSDKTNKSGAQSETPSANSESSTPEEANKTEFVTANKETSMPTPALEPSATEKSETKESHNSQSESPPDKTVVTPIDPTTPAATNSKEPSQTTPNAESPGATAPPNIEHKIPSPELETPSKSAQIIDNPIASKPPAEPSASDPSPLVPFEQKSAVLKIRTNPSSSEGILDPIRIPVVKNFKWVNDPSRVSIRVFYPSTAKKTEQISIDPSTNIFMCGTDEFAHIEMIEDAPHIIFSNNMRRHAPVMQRFARSLVQISYSVAKDSSPEVCRIGFCEQKHFKAFPKQLKDSPDAVFTDSHWDFKVELDDLPDSPLFLVAVKDDGTLISPALKLVTGAPLKGDQPTISEFKSEASTLQLKLAATLNTGRGSLTCKLLIVNVATSEPIKLNLLKVWHQAFLKFLSDYSSVQPPIPASISGAETFLKNINLSKVSEEQARQINQVLAELSVLKKRSAQIPPDLDAHLLMKWLTSANCNYHVVYEVMTNDETVLETNRTAHLLYGSTKKQDSILIGRD